MAAEIRHIYQCPRCDSGVTATASTTECPQCGLALGVQAGGRGFNPPLTLFEQQIHRNDKAGHLRALLELPHEKVMAVLQDALNIMEAIAVKKASATDIRSVVELGTRIGDIAKAYDAFIHAGGRHTPAIFLAIEAETPPPAPPKTTPSPQPLWESDNEYNSQTGAGEETSASSADAGSSSP